MSSNQQNMSAAKKSKPNIKFIIVDDEPKTIVKKIVKVQKPKKTRFPTCVWNYIKDFAGINNSKIMNRFLQPIQKEDTKIIKRLQKIWEEIDGMPYWACEINRMKFQNEIYCCEGRYEDQLNSKSENLFRFAEDDLEEFYELKLFIAALGLTEENSGCVTVVKECAQRFQEENPDWNDDKRDDI
jgi:hypothetical protein